MATFFNQATLSYNNTTVSSNIVTGEITETLTAAKTAVSDAYSPGEVLTYAVSLTNAGASPLTTTLTDNLGAYTFEGQTLVPLTYVDGSVRYFADGVLQAEPPVTVGDTLVISGITVPAEGDAVIIYQATANEFASPESGATILNTVTAGTTQATAEVPAENEAILSISKSLSPAEVPENGQITYTFIIQNIGNTAENTAVLRDTFDPVLNDIAVTIGTEKAVAADYTYDETTGEFATAAGALVVPAATYTRDPATGAWSVVPGTLTVTVAGNL